MEILTILFLLLISLFNCSNSWPYGQKPVRGVNLGSWLVLEKWITPAPFSGLPDTVKDEYTLCQYLGKTEAAKRLKSHWDSWVTENDIAKLKNQGINHLRIPIGYWALDIRSDEPWVSGSWNYVVKACGWAKKYGLQVMIDLHGAPGSQNGQDHSGRAGPVEFFYKDDNIWRAANIVAAIANWANQTEWRQTVSVIQILNEPILWDDYSYRLDRLKTYYRIAYDQIRKYNDIAVVAVHDAFIGAENWFYLRDDSHYYWIMLDTHLYQVFSSKFDNMTCHEHAAYPCNYISPLKKSNNKLWTVVGEWSLATPKPCKNQVDFARQQIGVYEQASGWFMWNFKHAQGWSEWSFFDSVSKGWINLKQNNIARC